MKYEAISRRELPRLIRQVLRDRHFEARRGGHAVQIAVEQSLTAEPISYGVCVGRHWQRGQASSIAAAVDAINQISRRRV